MKFTDAAALGGIRYTTDGYLVTDAFAVRTGIQLYAGSEVGKPDIDVVRVYRPEDEVRSPASLATFSHAPVTLGHPEQNVTKDNWAALAKGEVSTEATWDGNKIKLPLIVKDSAAIAEINSGVRQLSAGYTCDLAWQSGVTPSGEQYDAVQRNIKINHLAIVPQGRAGDECRIGDSAATWGATPSSPTSNEKEAPMADNLKTVVLGDQAVSVTADAAATIEKFRTDAAKALCDAQTAHTAALATKDEEIGTLKAKVKTLEDAAVTPEKLTKLIADRVSLETLAKTISADVACEGVSDDDLRKATVAAVHGDDMVKDASAAEIAGMFKALAKTAESKDVFADAMKGKKPEKQNAGAWDSFLPEKKEM